MRVGLRIVCSMDRAKTDMTWSGFAWLGLTWIRRVQFYPSVPDLSSDSGASESEDLIGPDGCSGEKESKVKKAPGGKGRKEKREGRAT